MRRLTAIGVFASVLLMSQGALFALTFSIDQGPAGSVPPYNDGTLLIYNTTLGPEPDCVSSVMGPLPVDALHIGSAVSGLLSGVNQGQGEWSDVTLDGSLAFSIDHGDPFPVGISPDSNEEIKVAQPVDGPLPPGDTYPVATAKASDLGLLGDLTASELNLGLGAGAAYDDDVDGLDTSLPGENGKLPIDVNPIFFSVDDLISLVPNLPSQMQTGDIYVRFPDGGVTKVLDAVTDLGLKHDGDSTQPKLLFNDDVDAMVFVTLDDDNGNNVMRTIAYTDPTSGKTQEVEVDLGDGLLFSLDRSSDLPYANGGTGPEHMQASLPTQYLYFSPLDGSTPIALISNAELGLSMGTPIPDDIDALGIGLPGGAIPEPGTLLLLGTAALGIAGWRLRRRLKA